MRKHFEIFRRKREQKQKLLPFKKNTCNSGRLNTTVYFDNNGASYKFISIGPKGLLKTQIFEKEGYLPGDKRFWTFFVLSSVTNLKGHFLRVQQVI